MAFLDRFKGKGEDAEYAIAVTTMGVAQAGASAARKIGVAGLPIVALCDAVKIAARDKRNKITARRRRAETRQERIEAKLELERHRREIALGLGEPEHPVIDGEALEAAGDSEDRRLEDMSDDELLDAVEKGLCTAEEAKAVRLARAN